MSVISEASINPMMIIFGKPGAGKTTIANAATDIVRQSFKSVDGNECSADRSKENCQSCINLDLDVCVPEWMKINFSKGIYPSLSQRAEFAESACEYVETEMRNMKASLVEEAPIFVIVSFSFVNTDLRDIFRSRFPNAIWALINVSDELAQDRINERVGHFFKGVPVEKPKGERNLEEGKTTEVESNGEWNFAPVIFPHTILDGRRSIEHNANLVAETLIEWQS